MADTPSSSGGGIRVKKQRKSDMDEFEDFEFEDPFEDAYEVEMDDDAAGADADEGDDVDMMADGAADGGEEEDDDDTTMTRAWRPDLEPLTPGQKLEYDSSAYDMLHMLQVDWPCLSFDFLVDQLGVQRTKVCCGAECELPRSVQCKEVLPIELGWSGCGVQWRSLHTDLISRSWCCSGGVVPACV
jgi:Histone-binding protein RBBP4 or subunit C of CAF1 complex